MLVWQHHIDFYLIYLGSNKRPQVLCFNFVCVGMLVKSCVTEPHTHSLRYKCEDTCALPVLYESQKLMSYGSFTLHLILEQSSELNLALVGSARLGS